MENVERCKLEKDKWNHSHCQKQNRFSVNGQQHIADGIQTFVCQPSAMGYKPTLPTSTFYILLQLICCRKLFLVVCVIFQLINNYNGQIFNR